MSVSSFTMIKHRGLIILIMSFYISICDFKKDFAYIAIFDFEGCEEDGGGRV